MNAITRITLPVSDIITDGGTQSRAQIYQSVVDDYADALGDGAAFPPVVVFYDGSTYWMGDGFHRYAAHEQVGLAEINVIVRQGTRRDAILHSVGCNAAHGLRRTNDDKRRAVLTLLNDPEWRKWTDREISRQCAVSHNFVSTVRRSLSSDDSDDEPRTYTTKHGTEAEMRTENIGRDRSDRSPLSQFADNATHVRQRNSEEHAIIGAPRTPVMDLQGRDPREFNRALHFLGTFENYAREIERENVEAATAILTEAERDQLRGFITRIDAVHDRIVTRI